MSLGIFERKTKGTAGCINVHIPNGGRDGRDATLLFPCELIASAKQRSWMLTLIFDETFHKTYEVGSLSNVTQNKRNYIFNFLEFHPYS